MYFLLIAPGFGRKDYNISQENNFAEPFFCWCHWFQCCGGPKVAKMLSRLLTQIAPFLVDWCSCERLSLVVWIADFFKFNGSCLQKCIEEIANVARIKHLTTIANWRKHALSDIARSLKKAVGITQRVLSNQWCWNRALLQS